MVRFPPGGLAGYQQVCRTAVEAEAKGWEGRAAGTSGTGGVRG